MQQTLFSHGVIFFRNQKLDIQEQKKVARYFGNIFIHPNFQGSGDDPEVVMVKRNPGDAAIVGEDWHSDTAMMAEPPMGAVLYGIDIPPVGGDTLFASQYMAYNALSESMKKIVDSLMAVNFDRNVAGPNSGLNNKRSTKVREDSLWRETTHIHPVVRVHPKTGRKALFISRPYTIAIDGMHETESKALLEFLFAHCVRPEFTCRFQWEQGSVAIWDNRCVMHLAINDTGPYHRLMRRIQISGDRPLGCLTSI
jgi:taurine dioxygenase